jgi:hypothetical protein
VLSSASGGFGTPEFIEAWPLGKSTTPLMLFNLQVAPLHLRGNEWKASTSSFLIKEFMHDDRR